MQAMLRRLIQEVLGLRDWGTLESRLSSLEATVAVLESKLKQQFLAGEDTKARVDEWVGVKGYEEHHHHGS